MPDRGDQNQRSAHARPGSHVTTRFAVLPHPAEEVLADHTCVWMGHGT
jgi:hypothetical protein